jgi:hypothetical protein
MKLTIKYVQDGEMNTESLDYFLETVIIPIASGEDLVYSFENKEIYSDILFEEVDISIFTTAWLANSDWDDEIVGVFQQNLLDMIGLKSEEDQVALCKAFWTMFNAIGAETYTWSE